MGDDAKHSLDVNDAVSPTKVAAFESCAWRYRESRLRGMAGGSDALDMGKAAHLWIERYGLHCRRAGVNQDVDTARQFIADEERSWFIEWRNDLSAMLETFAQEYQWPFGAGSSVAESEFEYKRAFDAAGAELPDYYADDAFSRLALDYAHVAVIDGRRIAMCIDWKTSSQQLAEGRSADVPCYKRKTTIDGRYSVYAPAPKDRQLRWYLKLLMHRWPDCDAYRVGHYYLRTGHWCLTPEIGRDQMDQILAGVTEEMLVASARLRYAREHEEYPATPCDWCNVCQFGPERGDDTCPTYFAQRQAMQALLAGIPPTVPLPQQTSTQPAPATPSAQPTPSSMMGDTATEDSQMALQFGRSSEKLPSRLPHKILLVGPEGSFKTLNVLDAFGSPAGTEEPRLFLSDGERGAEHYRSLFEWLCPMEQNAAGVWVPSHGNIQIELEYLNAVARGELPKYVTAAAFDSWTLFCARWEAWWIDVFWRRKQGKAGDKVEYYELQSPDKKVLRKEQAKVVEALIAAPYDLILTTHEKPKWAPGEMMKQIGTTADAWDITRHYCHTVIVLSKDAKTGRVMAQTEKDRSHLFPPRSAGKWPFWVGALRYYLHGSRPEDAPDFEGVGPAGRVLEPAAPGVDGNAAPDSPAGAGVDTGLEAAPPAGPDDPSQPGTVTPEQAKEIQATAHKNGVARDDLIRAIQGVAIDVDGRDPEFTKVSPVKMAELSFDAADALLDRLSRSVPDEGAADEFSSPDPAAVAAAMAPVTTETQVPAGDTIAVVPAAPGELNDGATQPDPSSVPPAELHPDGQTHDVDGREVWTHPDYPMGSGVGDPRPAIGDPEGPPTDEQKQVILALKKAQNMTGPEYIKRVRDVLRTASSVSHLNAKQADRLIQSMQIPI